MAMAGSYQDALQLLESIKGLHKPEKSPGGLTNGYCSGCDFVWPCPTYHLANGWEYWGCIDAAWCEHEKVVIV